MNENQSTRSSQAELLNLLHTRQGHFRFESGHHGNLWLDLDLLFFRPKDIQPFVSELARKLSSFGFDAVCGPMVGGALIAQNIASIWEKEFYYTERVLPQDSDALYVLYVPPGFPSISLIKSNFALSKVDARMQ